MSLVMVLLLCACTALAEETCPGLPQCFCSRDKTSVNCDGKHMTSLPPNIPDTATKLFISFNDITEIRSGEFSRLYRLEHLVMANNKITIIQPLAFSNNSMLTDVDLRNNKLQAVGPKAFAGMVRLSQLNLVHNKIGSIDETAFSDSTALTFLNVQANDLTEIPALGSLPILKKLIMTENSIVEVIFPESYTTCKRLSYIGLTQNKIKSLSNASFAALANNSLTSLSLSMNKISSVDSDTFKPLASISSLSLGNNPLDSISLKSALTGLHGKSIISLDISYLQLNQLMDDTFALLKNMTIKSLEMRNNTIPRLDDFVFSGLNYLLQLDISHCGIQTTSEKAFFGMDKLNILNMEYNKLTDVPANLPSSLNVLYMDSNHITSIKDKAFANLAMLSELRIRYNSLINLQEDAFYGLTNLFKLSLYDNHLASFPAKTFDSLTRLVSLDLAKNNMIHIQSSPDRFSSLGSLINLDLSDNKCEYFQPDLFKGLLSLKYLHLERNNLGSLIAKDYTGTLFLGLKNLEELYLMENELFAIPDSAFQDVSSLIYLNMSRNKVTRWGNDLFKTPTKLNALDLSFNLIATIKQENVHAFGLLKYWNLTGNPFACNCDLRWFRDWINTTAIELYNLKSYTCNAPSEWAGKPLMSFDKTKINCEHYTLKIIIIACAVVAVIVIIMGYVVYRWRWHIKLCCYKMMRRSRRRSRRAADGLGGYGAIVEEGKTYDAYVSCADEDQEWALQHLLPGIDKGQINDDHKFGGEFAMYYDARDSVAGESVVGNIYENMTVSRKVVVVLSRNYLTDKQHMFELDCAINMMYERTIEEIIVVHIDKGLPDHKIPTYLWKTMKRHQVVEWSNDENAKELFTRTLADRLAVKANAADLDAE